MSGQTFLFQPHCEETIPLPRPSQPIAAGRVASRETARKLREVSAEWRKKVFQFIADRGSGATDGEIERALSMPAGSIRPRRAELVDMGLIANSGIRRLTSSGQEAVVWIAGRKNDVERLRGMKQDPGQTRKE